MLVQHLLPNINYSQLSLEYIKQIVIDEALVLSNIVITTTTISFISNKYIQELSDFYYPSILDEYEVPLKDFKEFLNNNKKVRLNCFLNVEMDNGKATTS